MAATKNKPIGLQVLEDLSYRLKRAKCPNVPYLIRTTYRDDNSNDLTRCVIDWINFNSYQAERINSTGRQINIKGQNKWIPGSSTRGTERAGGVYIIVRDFQGFYDWYLKFVTDGR
ncbi:MAG: hypothetical protein IPL55_22845 [Saprospiraceae bacterium]|nr:hypothetical protein [Saprospiraceae bacterium]